MNIIYNNSYGNRGMVLEEDINLTNKYYLDNDIAVIYKKPTPIKIVKTTSDKKEIKEAYFESKSTLDYSGVWNGRYIEFDAKETNSKTSYPLSNIHSHQINHIKKIVNHNGICFLIVRFNLLNKTYILLGSKLLEFINNNTRKSIPLDYFEKYCFKVDLGYIPRLDYIKVLKKNNV